MGGARRQEKLRAKAAKKKAAAVVAPALKKKSAGKPEKKRGASVAFSPSKLPGDAGAEEKEMKEEAEAEEIDEKVKDIDVRTIVEEPRSEQGASEMSLDSEEEGTVEDEEEEDDDKTGGAEADNGSAEAAIRDPANDSQKEGKRDTQGRTIHLPRAWQPADCNLMSTGREGEVIVLLSAWETLYVQGSVQAMAIAGRCNVFGYTLSADASQQRGGTGSGQDFVEINAVQPHGPMGVEASGSPCSEVAAHLAEQHQVGGSREARSKVLSLLTPVLRASQTACALCLRRRTESPGSGASSGSAASGGGGGGGAVKWMPSKGAFGWVGESVGCSVLSPFSMPSLQPLKVPPDWRAAGDSLLALAGGGRGEGAGLRVGVLGAKGSCKSTLARYLCNVLLSRHGAVMHLESDVGQPEFTPAGLLSLSLVTKPLLGPPHTHIRTPVKAVFYGDVSPEEDPVLYRRCCSELSESFSEQQVAGAKVPLIINTCGWIKGLGLDLKQHLIKCCNATHIIACYVGNPRKDLPPPTRGGDEELWGAGVTVERMKPVEFASAKAPINATELRTMQLLTYLTGTSRYGQEAAKILARAVPYRVPLSALALHFLHAPVPASQELVAINGTLVGLAVSGRKGADRGGDQKERMMETLGLGVVRAVDPASKMLYVLSQLPEQDLQRVDTLVRGKLELPLQALNYYPASGRAPYLVIESLGVSNTGSSSMRSRSNILRKGHSA